MRRAARGEAPAWAAPATATVGESKRRPSSSALAATCNCTAGGANAARGGGAIVGKGVGASYTALGNGCSGLTAAPPSITTTALRPARAPRDRPVTRSTEMERASAEAPKARPGNAEEAPSKAGAAATTAAAAPAREESGARPPRVASGWTKAPPAWPLPLSCQVAVARAVAAAMARPPSVAFCELRDIAWLSTDSLAPSGRLRVGACGWRERATRTSWLLGGGQATSDGAREPARAHQMPLFARPLFAQGRVLLLDAPRDVQEQRAELLLVEGAGLRGVRPRHDLVHLLLVPEHLQQLLARHSAVPGEVEEGVDLLDGSVRGQQGGLQGGREPLGVHDLAGSVRVQGLEDFVEVVLGDQTTGPSQTLSYLVLAQGAIPLRI
mmetsp:Transcript_130617/g.418811  ORF Transcript_130617/g.418811 Transcript_130617/m.418811 type:complete len:382 (+) Transcript_130617:680-1825(+)